ncbi:MAG TPA: hypothetical protein PKY82_16900, partial [Pyrinomonadaceae bacterium]|nr:hypothetical protein [Pyrinomonadaceae bacterium]
MNPEHWQKVKSILEKALDLPADSRAEYLANACEGDEDLRREVENLLSFEKDDAGMLEQNAVSTVLEPLIATKDLTDTIIGKYKVIGELGVGGMGAVFLAERS